MNKSKTHIQVKNNAGYFVNANVLVGNNGSYSSGDILDANAVEQLINSKISNIVGGASAASDTLGEIEQQTSGLDSRLSSIEAKEILKTLIWRWFVSNDTNDVFLLCDSEGKVLKSSSEDGNYMIQGTRNSNKVLSVNLANDPSARAMATSWGQSTLELGSATGGYTINGIFFQNSDFTALPYKRSEFEVFTTSGQRPFAAATTRYVINFGVAVGYDGVRRFNELLSGDFIKLDIFTPTEELPDDPYYIMLYVDWVSANLEDPFVAGGVYYVENPYAEDPIPKTATVSFGNLIPFDN